MRLDEYLDLITSQHRKKRFMAAVAAPVAPLAHTQGFVDVDLMRAFDLDTAVGVQLDQIGLWVGRSRHLSLPIQGVYFAWRDQNVGWNQGYWKGRFDPEGGLVSLSDEPYRRLLRAKIAANSWDGTTPGAYAVWDAAFGSGDGQDMTMVIGDGQDMTMVIGIPGVRGDRVFRALLREGAIPLKPEGVRIRYYATSGNGKPLFGWGIENDAIGGWSLGEWIDKIYPEV